jgi:uncharacterized damage-inducible protein DinB
VKFAGFEVGQQESGGSSEFAPASTLDRRWARTKHNAWATEQLLSFCENLTEEQLAATAPGAVGSVFETLRHLIQAEGG